MQQRRPGNSRLVYDKAKRTIVPTPPPEQVEKVRQAIFNVLSGEAEPNTGMILAAVYEALGFPGVDHPPSNSTPN